MTYMWRKKDNILTASSLSSLHTCHLLLQSICRVVYKSAYNSNVNQLGKKQCICSIGSMWMYICVFGSANRHITGLQLVVGAGFDDLLWLHIWEYKLYRAVGHGNSSHNGNGNYALLFRGIRSIQTRIWERYWYKLVLRTDFEGENDQYPR